MRERGKANPKMEYQIFLCIFQMNFRLENEKKKSGIMKSGLNAMLLFLLDDLLKNLESWSDHVLFFCACLAFKRANGAS